MPALSRILKSMLRVVKEKISMDLRKQLRFRRAAARSFMPSPSLAMLILLLILLALMASSWVYIAPLTLRLEATPDTLKFHILPEQYILLVARWTQRHNLDNKIFALVLEPAGKRNTISGHCIEYRRVGIAEFTLIDELMRRGWTMLKVYFNYNWELLEGLCRILGYEL